MAKITLEDTQLFVSQELRLKPLFYFYMFFNHSQNFAQNWLKS